MYWPVASKLATRFAVTPDSSCIDDVVWVGVAAVKGTYQGKVSIADKEPPHRYRMLVEGSGGPGFVRGEARIELSASGEGTLVHVFGDGQVGGTVAGVGQRMLGGVAKMLMKQMFDCVKARVEAGAR